eukprot:366108-Chlamydomonas_euryale.AAC.3
MTSPAACPSRVAVSRGRDQTAACPSCMAASRSHDQNAACLSEAASRLAASRLATTSESALGQNWPASNACAALPVTGMPSLASLHSLPSAAYAALPRCLCGLAGDRDAELGQPALTPQRCLCGLAGDRDAELGQPPLTPQRCLCGLAGDRVARLGQPPLAPQRGDPRRWPDRVGGARVPIRNARVLHRVVERRRLRNSRQDAVHRQVSEVGCCAAKEGAAWADRIDVLVAGTAAVCRVCGMCGNVTIPEPSVAALTGLSPLL